MIQEYRILLRVFETKAKVRNPAGYRAGSLDRKAALLLPAVFAVIALVHGGAFARDEEGEPGRISSRAASLQIDSVDFVFKAGVQELTGVEVPLRIGGNSHANYVQISVDYDPERLSFRALKIENNDWVFWPGTPVTVDPEGRILATLLDIRGRARPPPQEPGAHFASLVFDLLPGSFPVDDYRLDSPLAFTPYDPGSLTQDPREETLVGILDVTAEDGVVDVVGGLLQDGGVTVYYADGIEIGGGGLTQREQSFVLPLYVTNFGDIDTINIGVDYDELILNLLRVRPTAPAAEGQGPLAGVDISYRSAPSGADFSIDVSAFRTPGANLLLGAHVADLEFHYAGVLHGGDGAGQGGPVNFIGGSLVVQPTARVGLGEGQAAENGGLGLRLLPGYLKILRPHFVRGNVDSSIFAYNPPEDGALIAREESRTSPDLGDPVAILRWLFSPVPGRETITCMEAADTNDDGHIQIDDAVLLLSTLFIGGDSPAAPFPYPGSDPEDSPSDLGCDMPLPVFTGD